MSDDKTIIPPHDGATLPELPRADNDTVPPDFGVIDEPQVIPAGLAEHAFGEALDALAAAFVRVESLGVAYARMLDAQSEAERSRS
jgi:hypothetical protein